MALPVRAETRTIYGGMGRRPYKLYEASLAELTVQSRMGRADAKARLDSAIERALTGSYTPVIIRYSGLVGVAYRTPYTDESRECWIYTISSEDSGRTQSGCSTTSDWSRSTVERDMRRHMAQMLGDDGDALLADDPVGLQEHHEYRAWQRGYREAQLEGYGDEECRNRGDMARRECRQLSRVS